ncbi:MmcQ/YjbR family DNA-binding protein [Dinoroseobacter sp. S124A]|uniref:MmcQ/YjbR family DNA-binding protein n=1 Tax=Dinoroseobacter sp. S124A TaxID=3415128 RepID=UPI003C7EB18B
MQTTSLLRDSVDTICARLPGAELALSEDEIPSWKVGGKMFACFGHKYPGVAVKCDAVETASMLIEAGVAERAPYFHKSWVRLPEDAAPEEIIHRVTTSYDLIRAKLPKALRDGLPPRKGA